MAKETDELNEIKVEAFKVLSKIWLHLGPEDKEELMSKLRRWFFFPNEEFNHEVWQERQREIFHVAQKIMSERKEKISFIHTPSGGNHSSAPRSSSA
jgi:hypothetical protein